MTNDVIHFNNPNFLKALFTNVNKLQIKTKIKKERKKKVKEERIKIKNKKNSSL